MEVNGVKVSIQEVETGCKTHMSVGRTCSPTVRHSLFPGDQLLFESCVMFPVFGGVVVWSCDVRFVVELY